MTAAPAKPADTAKAAPAPADNKMETKTETKTTTKTTEKTKTK
jgi:hypothetical protein